MANYIDASVPVGSAGPFGGQKMSDGGPQNMGRGQDKAERDKERINNWLARHAKMKGYRGLWETNWQECMDKITPRKAEVVNTRTPGSIRGAELYDSTAIYSNVILGGALHGMLTNPTTRFFDLTMGDARTDAKTEVKAWLDDTANDMYRVLQGSNFQTEISEIYSDLGSIGTASLWMGEHDETVIHFGARMIREIYVEENNLGLIDIVHREFNWTPRQIVQEFGREALPMDMQDDLNFQKMLDEKMTILHITEPSGDKKAQSIKRFNSVYLLKDKLHILKEAGFNEFPWAVPRWTKTSGEVYGRGPGMDALPDIRMVNEMMLTTLQAAQKMVDPPLLVEDDGVIGRVRLTPGGLTVVRPGGNGPRVVPLLTQGRVDFGYQAVEDVRKRIRASFFVDQLQLREGPQKTATEVNQLMEENLRLMGPVLSRQEFEFLGPVITRVFGIMHRKGLIRPAPPEIRGQKFSPKYSSLVARAQKMSEGANIGKLMAAAAPLFQIDPTLVDRVDCDEAFKELADIFGVNHRILKSDKAVQKLQQGRQQANAQMAQEKNQQHQAELVKKAAPGVAQLAQSGVLPDAGGNQG